ncbi:MAG: endonuclease/exonuclease/phosphatase family protein [Armatimonadetes bacterium]|nr:endonuclease/exonuclease/phosphatase family protein [Armatimonadota bacterium]
MPLTLLTINVWSGLNYRGRLRMGDLETASARRERYRDLVAELRALDSDIIAVNEANPLPAYLRRLAADLGYDEVHHPGLSGVRLGPLGLPINLNEGDGLLARRSLSLSMVGRAPLSGGIVGRRLSLNFGNATQLVAGRVLMEGRPLYLLCTHWSVATSAREYESQQGCLPGTSADDRVYAKADRWRLQEATRTLEHARRFVPEGAPAVLLGDLNAAPDSPEIERLRSAGWVDAWRHLHPGEPGSTWDQGRNQRIRDHYPAARLAPHLAERVDYVLVNPVLGEGSLLEARVVLDGSSRRPHPSDHFGVLVRIGFGT